MQPAAPRSRTVAAGLLLGAAAYTAWVLEVVPATGLDPVNAYVSELAAADQPLGGLFRATDLAAGLAVSAAAVIALLRLPRRPVVGRGLGGSATSVGTPAPPAPSAPSVPSPASRGESE
ncbi:MULTISPECIES: DUF998 domain-containing protein [unclassified Streptomyces]|uniref:DUF998 domain-containing protein n=1 Tax=unclassified Streptomyces TaxID=2593676 RepID=UPI0032D567D6